MARWTCQAVWNLIQTKRERALHGELRRLKPKARYGMSPHRLRKLGKRVKARRHGAPGDVRLDFREARGPAIVPVVVSD